MDKNCGNTNFETFMPNDKAFYKPSKEELNLGSFGYADEDDSRNLGWCGEVVADNHQDIFCEDFKSKPEKIITEKQLDDFVDETGCSYYEAYKHFNATPDNVEWESTPDITPKRIANKEGKNQLDIENLKDSYDNEKLNPHVNLVDRHLAISALMAIYNMQNKTQGAHLRGFDHLVKKYGLGEASRIVMNMDKKSDLAEEQIISHIDTLTATDDLIDAGFGTNDVLNQKQAIRHELQHSYGPGNANSKDREKLVKRVKPPQEKSKRSNK